MTCARSLCLHWFLIATAFLAPAGLFLAAGAYDRAAVLQESRDSITRSVSIMHEHARKVLETAELALARVDDRVDDMTWDAIAAPETGVFLARLKAPLDQVVAFWIADAQGNIRAGSQAWNPASSSIASRDFFQVQREQDAGTYVSSAFMGKATARATFAISRRRSSSSGQFDGTLHIGLDPEYFARFYADAAPDLPHTGLLVRVDGEVLIREPTEIAHARLSADSLLMRGIAARPEGGFLTGESSVDDRQRLVAYRKVEGYPLYVALSVDKGLVLKRWRRHLTWLASGAAAASFALLLLSVLALRSVKSERSATTQLRSALEDLQQETIRREAAEGRVRQAQRMEAVGQLTAGIAHDFNNLLTAVLCSLEMLRRRVRDGDERIARLIDTAEKGAQRGAALTQRLLAFSRSQTLKPEAVNVLELVQGMSDLLSKSLGGNVRIETRFPVSVAPARVDAGQFELALLNLAINARDALPGGGIIIITAREEELNSEGDSDLLPGNYVVLSVVDAGAGMDAKTLARCIEPFFTTKGVGKGTGLGLSMVHGLAAQSGGRLVIRSQQGQGTTAELWLPRAETQAAPVEAPAVHTTNLRPQPLSLRTVLVVDDDPLVLAGTASMLEDLGYTAIEAASGRQALEILRAGAKVDLVLTDYAMPGMTGVQLATQLHQLRYAGPLLLASGYADTAELVASGIPLLPKPFGQATLGAAVEQCVITFRSTKERVVLFRPR